MYLLNKIIPIYVCIKVQYITINSMNSLLFHWKIIVYLSITILYINI